MPAVKDRLPAAATRLRPAALSWTAAPACSDISWLMAATGLGCAGLGGPGRICANCYTLPSVTRVALALAIKSIAIAVIESPFLGCLMTRPSTASALDAGGARALMATVGVSAEARPADRERFLTPSALEQQQQRKPPATARRRWGCVASFALVGGVSLSRSHSGPGEFQLPGPTAFLAHARGLASCWVGRLGERSAGSDWWVFWGAFAIVPSLPDKVWINKPPEGPAATDVALQ